MPIDSDGDKAAERDRKKGAKLKGAKDKGDNSSGDKK
jgi:hypothetical protein